VELAGISDANRGVIARFILPFETIDSVPPPCETPRVVRPSVLRRAACAALTSATPSWTSLRAAGRANLALLPYQLEPALAMTHGASCRFLLADEVGLGKTIQAGLLIAELLARERDARILIVTPAGLRDQWRDELRERFAIEADVLDAAGLARVSARLPIGVNPWAVPRVVLTSIDFVKRPDVIRALEPLVWDLAAFDEAHALAGRSDRATAAELIAQRARRVVAITATPHSGDQRAFERLCSLGRLPNDKPMLLFRRSRAQAGVAGSRSMRLLRVRPTPAEEALHRALESYARRVWHDAPQTSSAGARLAMLVLARRACSSPASLHRSIQRRVVLLDRSAAEADVQLRLPLDGGTIREDEEPSEELAAPGLADVGAERRLLERIRLLAEAAMVRESKIKALVRLIRRSRQPAIVFTEYRDTLERLASVITGPEQPLRREGIAILHGGLTAHDRIREVRRFTHGDAQLLLATDAASEGLNLHHRCRLVINLEVPWTPLRLEQRIGRVDRLGQERRVHAIGLIGRGTAEESIVGTLLARASLAAREAPFGTVGVTPPTHLTVVSVRDEALAETARLQICRELARRANSPGDRPLVSILTRRFPRLICALRAGFIDHTDVPVWDTVIASAVLTERLPSRRGRNVREWFARIEETHGAEIQARTAELHETLLRRLRADLSAAVQPLIAREEAILQALVAEHGRLAAPLVQPGLFDRRALRDAVAQRQMAEEATAVITSRILALRRLADPIIGERRLIFALGGLR
jgi:superfamily II DNA or RNA helicase